MGQFIETRGGEQLFYRDRGTGRPIVFVSAWALPAAMWDYQVAATTSRRWPTTWRP